MSSEFLLSGSKLRPGYAEKLKPLITGAKDNHVALFKGISGENILIKTVASRYPDEFGIHLLYIPDTAGGENIPGIENLTTGHLSEVLRLSATSATTMLAQDGIGHVDFGWHYANVPKSKNDPKPTPASEPLNMHVHVVGWNTDTLDQLGKGYHHKKPELAARIEDPLQEIGEDLFFNEIVSSLKASHQGFSDLFEEVPVYRSRYGLKLHLGEKAFENPKLAEAIKAIDQKAKQLYRELGTCFFEEDEGKFKFQTKNVKYPRYKLLNQDERLNRIDNFIAQRPWMTRESIFTLRWLARNAKSSGRIISRERKLNPDIEDIQIASRFFAYIGLVETFVFSAKKKENDEIEWIFRFDPNIFSSEGVVRASAYEFKALMRDRKSEYTQVRWIK